MATYSDEYRDSIVVKMLSPHNVGVPQLARETGIPRDTLYGWRRQAGVGGRSAGAPGTPAGALDGAEKFAVVVETAALNELELGEYCRRKGLFAEQVAAWRATCRQANDALPTAAERAERRADRERIASLSRQLQRKDRALAEAAALPVLQKKVRAIWEEPADARSPTNDGYRRTVGSPRRAPPGRARSPPAPPSGSPRAPSNAGAGTARSRQTRAAASAAPPSASRPTASRPRSATPS